MSDFDFTYVNRAPVASVAFTVDSGVNDPRSAAYTAAQAAAGAIGGIGSSDKYMPPNELVFIVEGGTPTLQLWMFSKAANPGVGKWVLFQDAITPTPAAPAHVKIPPYAQLAIFIVNASTATAIYAGIMPN